jgi:hypothetical protein
MILNGCWPVFLLGVFGGFLGELLKWYRLRERQELPDYVKSPFYWCVTLFLIVAGGVLALCYGTKDVNALMAANIGLSAPLIIQSLSGTFGAAQTKPHLNKGQHPQHGDDSKSLPHSYRDEGTGEYDSDAFGATQINDGELVVAGREQTKRFSRSAMFWRFLAG